jgi:hypothetical protein
MYRRRHHLIGNPVRFLFENIPRLVNLKLCLQTNSLHFAALLALTARQSMIAAGACALEQPAGGMYRG